MRVLQINSVYGKGSTGKIVKNIHDYLISQGYESFVCYGRGELNNEPGIVKTCGELYSKINNALSRINGMEYANCHKSTKCLISEIEKIKPDIVHLHCLNGYYVNIFQLISYLKKSKIPVILTLHAEFMYTANCGHAFECEKWKTGCGRCPRLRSATGSLLIDGTHKSWMKMQDAFNGFNRNLLVISVSPWLMDRARISPILADKNHRVVLNGLDTTIFHYYETGYLRESMGLLTKKIVFHATPWFNNDPKHIKGGYYIIELAKRLPNVAFVIAGGHPDSLKVPDNIILLGTIKDQVQLANYYAMADLTLLASKKETFSMVVAESLCCGTPIVGFKAGAPEQIALQDYSCFCEYADIDMLEKNVINSLHEWDKTKISMLAKDKYSKETMALHYLSCYEEMLS